ncbi:hypothetical protein ABFB50_00880 [Dehalococcoides sp. THU3]|uniref:hypothetical protein n=1 Tax=Dehalococcoides TaxID=61434 RepID=UPI003218B712
MTIRALNDIDATITVGTPTLGAFPVSVQLTGPTGKDLQEARVVKYYLAKDATGDTLCVDGTDTSDITIGTDGTIIAETAADVAGIVKSEADGDIDFVVTVLTTKKAYLVIVLPDGEFVISAEMAYTAA